MRRTSLVAFATVAVATVAVANSLAAETRSWNKIKAKLPAGTEAVIGIDAEAARKTAMYAGLLAMISKEKDVKQVLDGVKSACQLEAPSLVSDVTLVFGKASAVAIGFTISSDKLAECAKKAVDGIARKKLAITVDGKITKYTAPGLPSLWGTWLTNDVLLVPFEILRSEDDTTRKRALDTFIAAGAPSAGLAAVLRRVDLAKPVWFAVDSPDDKEMKSGFGTVAVADQRIVVAAKVVAISPELAKQGAGAAKAKLSERAKGAKPEVAKVLNAVKVTANGSDIDISATVADGDFESAWAAFDKMF